MSAHIASILSSTIRPVVLCGGSGTRLWPLSRLEEPKQFLPLVGERSLLQDTLHRLSAAPFGRPIILCNRQHLERVRADLADIASGDGQGIEIVLEPAIRSTGPAIAAAALVARAEGDDPLLLVAPSDHWVGDPSKLIEAVVAGTPFAAAGGILLFGIRPTGPETGFGYIQAGEAGANPVSAVAAFIEKPSLERAHELLRDARYTWNSGLFLFRASTILKELEAHAPDILRAASQAVASLRAMPDALELGPAFATAPNISIDYAVMERSARLGVIPVAPEWSDLGSFDALWQASEKDGDANHLEGDVHAIDVTNSFVRAPHRPVAVIGLDDVVVVDTEDALLVASRSRSQDVKTVASALAARGHASALRHPTCRAAGYRSRTLSDGPSGRILEVTIEAGQRAVIAGQHDASALHLVTLRGTVAVETGRSVHRVGKEASVPLGSGASTTLPPHGELMLFNPFPTRATILVCALRGELASAGALSQAS